LFVGAAPEPLETWRGAVVPAAVEAEVRVVGLETRVVGEGVGASKVDEKVVGAGAGIVVAMVVGAVVAIVEGGGGGR